MISFFRAVGFGLRQGMAESDGGLAVYGRSHAWLDDIRRFVR